MPAALMLAWVRAVFSVVSMLSFQSIFMVVSFCSSLGNSSLGIQVNNRAHSGNVAITKHSHIFLCLNTLFMPLLYVFNIHPLSLLLVLLFHLRFNSLVCDTNKYTTGSKNTATIYELSRPKVIE